MARNFKNSEGILRWADKPRKENSVEGVGRVEIWSESTFTFRVSRYLSSNPLIFFASIKKPSGSRPKKWQLLSRHADLESAKHACEKYAAAS